MANADGSIVIKADIDNKQAQKELAALEKKIDALQDKLNSKKSARNSLFNQANNLGAQLDEAKAKLAQMKGGGEFFTSDAIKQQEAAVASMEKEWSTVNDRLDKQNAAIREGEAELDKMKEKAGELAVQLGNAGKNAGKIKAGTDKASQSVDAFTKRVKKLAKQALVLTVITKALSALRGWLADVVVVNGEARDAIAQLKGALLTLAQPLVQVIIPAFTMLVKVLTAVVSVVASIVSGLFGTTAKESASAAKSLNDQKNAYKGVGSAAKSASKQLASFDEINKLSGESDESSTGGGVSIGDISPDFSFMDSVSERLKGIARDVLLIGAGFALWKIAKKLPDALGKIGTKIAGIAIAVGSLLLMLDGLKDAWENGVDWGNLTEILAGATGLAIGLYMAFGEVGAGIGLVVAGIAMMATAFNDIEENGANLKNTLLLIAGIIATGLGFFFLTGSVIPLFIARIAAVVVAVLALTGNLEEFCKNLKENIFGGIIDFFTGVFTGDWEKAWDGLKKIFKGFWNADVMIVESAINLIIKGVNWLINQLNKIQFDVPDWVPIIGGKSLGINIPHVNEVTLPRLAQGAVIPPNREFMAVLGDQKSGTNIETPLATMVQAFKQALAESGYGGSNEAVLVLDKEVLGRVVYRLNKSESNRIGVSLAGVNR